MVARRSIAKRTAGHAASSPRLAARKPQAGLTAGGAYDQSIAKQGHRQLFLTCATRDPLDDRPLLYLEGEEAGLTRFLISRGVDASRLRPCNRSSATCAAIHHRTGVLPLCGDIEDAARRAPHGAFGVAWFDMTGRSVDLAGVHHVSQY